MANYYYVKNGGTATGATVDSTATNGIANTMLSGTWSATASEYFNTINAAISSTTPPTEGDFIFCSDLHSIASAAGNVIPVAGVIIVSVDNANKDSYKAGAYELEATVSLQSISSIGVDYDGTPGAMIFLAVSHNTVSDCTLTTYGSNDNINAASDGSEAELNNVNIDFTNGSFEVNSGAKISLNNCRYTGSGTPLKLVKVGGAGGAHFHAYGCDFSSCGVTTPLIDGTDDINSDRVDIKLHRCLLPTGYTLSDSIACRNTLIELNSCDTGNGYYVSEKHTFYGDVVTDTSIHLSALYSDTEKLSIEMDSNSYTNIVDFVRYKLISIPAQDLTSSKNITINTLTDGLTLNSANFWVEAVYNNNTSLALGSFESTRATDILDTSSDLTTNTESWTESLASPVKQEATIAIDALSNVDNGLIDIYVNFAVKNDTVWVCPDVVIT